MKYWTIIKLSDRWVVQAMEDVEAMTKPWLKSFIYFILQVASCTKKDRYADLAPPGWWRCGNRCLIWSKRESLKVDTWSNQTHAQQFYSSKSFNNIRIKIKVKVDSKQYLWSPGLVFITRSAILSTARKFSDWWRTWIWSQQSIKQSM